MLAQTMPETTRAVLHCKKCERPTRHYFLYREGVPRMASGVNLGVAYWLLVYSCGKCQTERVWGTEER